MIHRRTLCTLLAAAPAALIMAQAPWAKLYWSPEDLAVTNPVQVEEAHNGDLVLLSRVSDHPDERLRFIRLDAEGALLNAVDIHAPGIFFPYALVELTDGRWMAGGTGTGAYNDGFIMVLGPMGDLLTLYGLPTNATGNVFSLLARSDTTALASFWSYHGTDMRSAFAVIHPDSLALTATALILPDRRTDVRTSSRCADGGAYHSGWTIGTVPEHEMYLARTDSTGAVQWARRLITGGHGSTVTGIAEMPDGGAMLGGTYFPVLGESRPFILRTSATGLPLWAYYLVDTVPPSATWDLYEAVLLSPDTFLLAGHGDSGSGIRMAVDTNGTLLFADRSDGTALQDMHLAANGDVLHGLRAGSPFGTGTAQGLLRTDDDLAVAPCIHPPLDFAAVPITLAVDTLYSTAMFTLTCQDLTALFTQTSPPLTTTDACFTTPVGPVEGRMGPRVWPVPAHDRCTVEGPGIREAWLVDPMGRAVRSVRRRSSPSRVEFGLDGLPAGIYQLRVLSDAGWTTHAVMKE